MGKLLSGGVLSNNLTGKIGNVVYSRVSNTTTIRAYQPKVTNPNTRAQKIQRLKFKTVNDIVSKCYNSLSSIYGKAVSQYSKRTAVSAMIFRNPLILSQGYQNNYYPKSPINNQDLIFGSYDLTNEALNNIEFIYTPAANGTPETLYPVLRIPKSLCGSTNPQVGQLRLGTNIPLTNLSLICCVNAKNVINIPATIGRLQINPNYNGSDDFSIMISPSSDGISSGFKYQITLTCTSVASSGDDFLFGFTEVYRPGDYGFSSETWKDSCLIGTWLGDSTATAGSEASRVAITMFAIAQNTTDNVLFDDESTSSLLSKVCLTAKNYVVDVDIP